MSRLSDWANDAKRLLDKQYGDPFATAVALHYMKAIKVANILLSSNPEPDDLTDARRANADLLLGFTVALPLNPFWQTRSGLIQPFVTPAFAAWADALQYFADDDTKPDDAEGRTEFFAKTVGLKNMGIEIAVAVFLALKGSSMVTKDTIELRDSLIKLDLKYKV